MKQREFWELIGQDLVQEVYCIIYRNAQQKDQTYILKKPVKLSGTSRDILAEEIKKKLEERLRKDNIKKKVTVLVKDYSGSHIVECPSRISITKTVFYPGPFYPETRIIITVRD